MGPGGGVHRRVRGAGPHPVQVQRHLHRPAYGRELGGSGGGVPGPLPLRAVLEADHQGRLLGQLPVLHGGHAGQHLRALQLPRSAPVPHQRRGLLYAGGAGDCAGGQPGYARPGSEEPGRDVCLL